MNWKNISHRVACLPGVFLARVVAKHGVHGSLVHHEVEGAGLEREIPCVENLKPEATHVKQIFNMGVLLCEVSGRRCVIRD